MKKLLFAAAMLCGGFTGFAQCDKQVVLTSSKTEYLDASGNVGRSQDENSTIEIRKDTLIIAPGTAPHKMVGTISSHTCNWTTPYKVGKSVIKSTMADEGGNTMNITVTIEGKDGKVTLLAEVEEMPDQKIRVPIDKFEEKK